MIGAYVYDLFAYVPFRQESIKTTKSSAEVLSLKCYNNKIRIGILTFHRALNYGALLQTYALQETLKKLGCEPNIIDYRSKVMESRHHEARISDCHSLQDLVRFIFYAKHRNRKHKKFRDYSAANLVFSDVCVNCEQLNKLSSEYDKFICGSDQVWNYKLTEFDRNYLLDFTQDTSKKNSYAASFGISNIPTTYRDDYKTLLNGFSHISVRENQGKEIIKGLINREAELVLDPTLLMTKQEWGGIATDYQNKKEYILLYTLGSSPTIKTFVEELSRKTGYSIVYISYSIIKKIDAIYEKCVGPTEFLGLFKNARYVVTNSFHGTCFSLSFNKDFFLELLPESQGVNSRLEHILDTFDLRSRQIINGKTGNIFSEIDYITVNNKLESERQRSLDFLKRILEE